MSVHPPKQLDILPDQQHQQQRDQVVSSKRMNSSGGSSDLSDTSLNLERKLSMNSNGSSKNSGGDSFLGDEQLLEERVPFLDFAKCDLRLRITEVESKLFHRTKYQIEVQSEKFPTKMVQRVRGDFDILHSVIQKSFLSIELPELPRKLVSSKKKRVECYEEILMKIVEASNTSSQVYIATRLRRILYNFLFSLEAKYRGEDQIGDQAERELTRKVSLEQQEQNQKNYSNSSNAIVPTNNVDFLNNEANRNQNYEQGVSERFPGIHIAKQSVVESDSVSLDASQQHVKDQIEYYNKMDQGKEKTIASRFLHKKPLVTDELRKDGYFMLNFSGEENAFQQYFVQICTQNIYAFSLKSRNSFEYAIPCASLQIALSDHHITFGHRYDKHQVVMKPSGEPTAQSQNILTETYKELQKCVTSLSNVRTTGKVILEVIDAKIPFSVEGVSYHIVVKHQHSQFELTKKALQDSTIHWRQKIMLPLFDNYSEIEVELYRTSPPTRILKSSKEELVGTGVVLVADVLRNIYTHSMFIMEVKVKPTKPQQQQQAAATSDKQSQQHAKQSADDNASSSLIVLRFNDFSHISSYFAISENADKYENKVLNKDRYDPKERLESKMTKNRVRRLKTQAKVKLNSLSEILNFKYPRVSYLAYLVSLFLTYLPLLIQQACVVNQSIKLMAAFALTFNMNQLIPYCLITFIIVTLMNHENFQKNYKQKLGKCESFFAKLNDKYEASQIETIEQFEMHKLLSPEQVIAVKQEGLITKVKKYYKQLGYINYVSFLVISLVEKFKNLTTWIHYQKTYMSILASVIAIVVYQIIPFNLLFAILIIKRGIDGRNYYEITKAHNRAIVSQFVKEIIRKFFPEFSDNIKYRDKDWVPCFSFSSFNKTMVEQITQHLKFKVDEDHLLKQYKTYNQLCGYLSSTHNRILFDKAVTNELPNIQYKQSYFAKKSGVKRILTQIYYFLYNIPSDQYLILHKVHN